jgi:hypothetical protein
MKKLFTVGLIIAQIILASSVVLAEPVKKNGKHRAKTSPGAKLSTDIQFNDSLLHGHYQTPDEATARVENEKVLADLLAVRTSFKDRLKKASEQN